MSRSPAFFAVDEFYHLYNRGVDKRNIFINNHDRDRFITLLYLCNSVKPLHRSNFTSDSMSDLLSIGRKDTLVDIGAYCLMSNHFHLLIKERTEGGISSFMQKLSTAYTMYFNKLHERSGSLFQGRFKAQHLDSDNYLKYIFSYIHLNPLSKVGSKNAKDLELYRYSSYSDYAKESPRIPEGKIINKSAFPDYFPSHQDFRSHLEDWVTYGKVEP